jgi:hypothetical protein
MPTKWIGFGEEDSDKFMAQEGQFVNFWDDCGGLLPPPSVLEMYMDCWKIYTNNVG